ncbi:unnamed protein product, partial [Bubo scandiacus]
MGHLVLGLVLLAGTLAASSPPRRRDLDLLQEVALDMAPNSFDDQYRGLQPRDGGGAGGAQPQRVRPQQRVRRGLDPRRCQMVEPAGPRPPAAGAAAGARGRPPGIHAGGTTHVPGVQRGRARGRALPREISGRLPLQDAAFPP